MKNQTEDFVAFVAREAKRLGAVPVLLPTTPEGKQELVNALADECQSQDHVKQVISRFLRESRECRNIVAELVYIARETAKPEEIPDGCNDCMISGTDMRPTGGPGPLWSPFIPGNNGGLRRCTCARGQWFERHDAKRAAAEAERRAGWE